MTTLVTGATGFVGSSVVRRLLKTGHNVRVLLRPSSELLNVRGMPVEMVHGDLTDAGSVRKAVKGCEYVFHVAADYRLWVPDGKTIYRNNVTGTRNVMIEALNNDVRRVVYTSSVATLSPSRNGDSRDESCNAMLDEMVGHYKRSKFLAESLVNELVRDRGLPAVIVSPSTPVGPRDIKPTATGRIVLDAITGRMPAYVNTGLNLVHVDDVASGHLLALEKGKTGDRYILGGENMTLREILHALSRIAGHSPPKFRIPHSVATAVACASEGWAKLCGGKEPRVTLDAVKMARKHMFFSCKKAVEALGYRPRPAVKGLMDAVQWFQENGYCD